MNWGILFLILGAVLIVVTILVGNTSIDLFLAAKSLTTSDSSRLEEKPSESGTTERKIVEEQEFLCSDRYTELDGDGRVFVKTDYFYHGPIMWRGQLHSPKISNQVVISGQSDYGVTPEIAARYPRVRHWFAINNESRDSRIMTLPLGVTNDTDESPVHRIYGNQAVLRKVQLEPRFIKNLAYLNMSRTHPSRDVVIDLFSNQPWVTVGKSESTMEGREQFLRDIRNHEFCFCPRGNGLDTHRLWETLYMGSIPIVEYDPAYSEFRDLPIYFVTDWQKDVTPEKLRSVKTDFASRSWNLEKLYWPYWKAMILQGPRLRDRISKQPSWVLIHTGPPLPGYARICFDQLQKSNPGSTVYIICETDPGFGTWIPLEDIPVSAIRRKFLDTTSLDTEFNNAFWMRTCLRLFVLYDFMEFSGVRNVVHIEYDNLVFTKASDILKQVPDQYEIACPRIGAHRLLANVFFVRQPTPLRALLEFISSHEYANEMMYLHGFQSSQKVYPIYELPITPEHPHYVSGMFDAAALGQCIGGLDPICKKGNTDGFVNEESPWPDLRPDWVVWRDGRPYFRGKEPIMNLHIHSKNLARWILQQSSPS